MHVPYLFAALVLTCSSFMSGCCTDIPDAVCPMESDGRAQSLRAHTDGIDPPVVSAAMALDDASRAFADYEKSSQVILAGPGYMAADLQKLEDTMLSYLLAIGSAAKKSYAEGQIAADTGGQQGSTESLKRFASDVSIQHKLLQTVSDRLNGGAKHAALWGRAPADDRPRLQQLLCGLRNAIGRAQSLGIQAQLQALGMPRADAAEMSCYESCADQGWLACSSCLMKLGSAFQEFWNSFCREWNSCSCVDISCVASRAMLAAEMTAKLAGGSL